MEDNNRAGYGHDYIRGNTVRRLETAPRQKPPERREAPRRTREEDERSRRSQRAVKRNQERELAMNFGYVLFLSILTVVCCIACAAYIHMKSDISIHMNTIASLQGELTSAKEENDATEKRIETAMNLEEIKKMADKLGMDYAGKSQVEYYSIDSSDYMNQFGEIPN